MNPDALEFKSLTAAVKAVASDEPNGEFEAILSTDGVDREGESIAPGAFDPLPASIPIYHQHDWMEKALPVARAVPSYDADGKVRVKGTYASTDRGQEMRQLVTEGVVDSMSAGYLTHKKAKVKGVPTVSAAELIEGSFTAVPVNTGALVTASKALALKAGARNSAVDAATIQSIHDAAEALGATCATTKSMKEAEGLARLANLKAIAGSYEDRTEELREALRELIADSEYLWIRGTFPDRVVYEVEERNPDGGLDTHTYQRTYTAADDGESFTFGDPTEVDVDEVVVPETSSDPNPEAQPAAPAATAAGAAGKALPAAGDETVDDVAERARAIALLADSIA
jgi:HK97 family phage prohead protease